VESRLNQPPEGYVERHHILPKSLGGTDESNNMVSLTAREHWIAHLLLHKIHDCPQTLYACNMMNMAREGRDVRHIRNSRSYERIRKQVSKERSISNKKRVGTSYKLNPNNNHEYVCGYCGETFVRRSRKRRDYMYCSRPHSMLANKGAMTPEMKQKISIGVSKFYKK
jgi:5-methylcytosine-specific restriction endonuclease McrA